MNRAARVREDYNLFVDAFIRRGLLDQLDELIAQRLWLQNELDNVGAG
tara:strand:+ start:243 stop:386 length:144 start_codon:yes stop_codon:yes gene_type:complete